MAIGERRRRERDCDRAPASGDVAGVEEELPRVEAEGSFVVCRSW